MNLDVFNSIVGLVGTVVVVGTVIYLSKQLKQQRTQTTSDAYFSAIELMHNHWDMMNHVMSEEFPGPNGWESNKREEADRICMLIPSDRYRSEIWLAD